MGKPVEIVPRPTTLGAGRGTVDERAGHNAGRLGGHQGASPTLRELAADSLDIAARFNRAHNGAMAMDTLSLGQGADAQLVDLIYLRDKTNLGCMRYFNSARFPGLNAPDLESRYKKSEATLVAELTAAVVASGKAFDAIVSPPSDRRDLTDPYRLGIATKLDLTKRDLTDRFAKNANASSSAIVKKTGNKTLQEKIAGTDYDPSGDEAKITSLLIVDDALASGDTARVVLHHLRAAGMSADAAVTLAVAARMDA